MIAGLKRNDYFVDAFGHTGFASQLDGARLSVGLPWPTMGGGDQRVSGGIEKHASHRWIWRSGPHFFLRDIKRQPECGGDLVFKV